MVIIFGALGWWGWGFVGGFPGFVGGHFGKVDGLCAGVLVDGSLRGRLVVAGWLGGSGDRIGLYVAEWAGGFSGLVGSKRSGKLLETFRRF